MTSTIIVPTSLDNERVDRVIALLTGMTRVLVADLIKRGEVTINEAVVTANHRRVAAGDELSFVVPEVHSATAVAVQANSDVVFDVVYVDDEIIVVNKPAGLVVHPGAGHEHDTLVSGLLARFPDLGENVVGDPMRPGIVHRLDKDTSGLLVVARTACAHAGLVAQLQQRSMHRRYTALVIGHVSAATGTIEAPIGRSERNPTLMTITASGRAARTHYQVMARTEDPIELTLVEARLETGRTHQIRVHFAAIEHPVAGDARYRGARPELALHRPFLHARRLELAHPADGRMVSFEAPLASDLADFLDLIGLHEPELDPPAS